MVEKPNRVGLPEIGCCQLRSASAVMAPASSPLLGGAANRSPITEKRNVAHFSWTRLPRACSVMDTLLVGTARPLQDARLARCRSLLRESPASQIAVTEPALVLRLGVRESAAVQPVARSGRCRQSARAACRATAPHPQAA